MAELFSWNPWDNKQHLLKGRAVSGQSAATSRLRGATQNLKGSKNTQPPQPTYFENQTFLGAASPTTSERRPQPEPKTTRG